MPSSFFPGGNPWGASELVSCCAACPFLKAATPKVGESDHVWEEPTFLMQWGRSTLASSSLHSDCVVIMALFGITEKAISTVHPRWRDLAWVATTWTLASKFELMVSGYLLGSPFFSVSCSLGSSQGFPDA